MSRRFFGEQLSKTSISIYSYLFQAHPRSLEITHTRKFRELILFEHNKIRNTLACAHDPTQKSAIYMKAFTWNYELGFLAQQISKRCEPNFRQNYCFHSIRFPKLGVMTDFSRDSYNARINKSAINPLNSIKTIIKSWPENEENITRYINTYGAQNS